MKNLYKIFTIMLLLFQIVHCTLNIDNCKAQWIQTNGPYGGDIRSFTVSGTKLFAGTEYGGVFLSTNNGTNWTAVNNGLTSTYIYSLAVSGTDLIAGTGGGGVWRRPLSEIISVENISSEVPEQFNLEQNYPNPFNPVTNLEFGISDLGFVSLKVYDILGKEIITLVNEKLNPGNYKVEFDGSGLTSGVYLYRLVVSLSNPLTAGEFTDTKKMLIIK